MKKVIHMFAVMLVVILSILISIGSAMAQPPCEECFSPYYTPDQQMTLSTMYQSCYFYTQDAEQCEIGTIEMAIMMGIIPPPMPPMVQPYYHACINGGFYSMDCYAALQGNWFEAPLQMQFVFMEIAIQENPPFAYAWIYTYDLMGVTLPDHLAEWIGNPNWNEQQFNDCMSFTQGNFSYCVGVLGLPPGWYPEIMDPPCCY